ncbi:hypothetical protein J2S82_003688 [Aeromonas caviae]|nr:hypothetical protein [Aeromonas caviae]
MDVEHVVPKSKAADLEVEWTNLLLGCSRCNRDFKKNNNDNRDGYLWPDTHNTYGAFVYEETGKVMVNPSLDAPNQQAAERIKALVKLDDGQEVQKTLNLGRKAEFKRAKLMKELFVSGYMNLDGLMLMVDRAPYWSVWMTVFTDVPEVKERLINDSAFPGTADQWFE